MTITTKVLVTVLALGGCNEILDNPRPRLSRAGGAAGALVNGAARFRWRKGVLLGRQPVRADRQCNGHEANRIARQGVLLGR